MAATSFPPPKHPSEALACFEKNMEQRLGRLEGRIDGLTDELREAVLLVRELLAVSAFSRRSVSAPSKPWLGELQATSPTSSTSVPSNPPSSTTTELEGTPEIEVASPERQPIRSSSDLPSDPPVAAAIPPVAAVVDAAPPVHSPRSLPAPKSTPATAASSGKGLSKAGRSTTPARARAAASGAAASDAAASVASATSVTSAANGNCAAPEPKRPQSTPPAAPPAKRGRASLLPSAEELAAPEPAKTSQPSHSAQPVKATLKASPGEVLRMGSQASSSSSLGAKEKQMQAHTRPLHSEEHRVSATQAASERQAAAASKASQHYPQTVASTAKPRGANSAPSKVAPVIPPPPEEEMEEASQEMEEPEYTDPGWVAQDDVETALAEEPGNEVEEAEDEGLDEPDVDYDELWEQGFGLTNANSSNPMPVQDDITPQRSGGDPSPPEEDFETTSPAYDIVPGIDEPNDSIEPCEPNEPNEAPTEAPEDPMGGEDEDDEFDSLFTDLAALETKMP